ncbi:hypothetical protein OF83DRAFT_1173488 [Amylostereum chailletii]|nr:hypothetical protein OF83DRAFT_1173488 [Amylostereum chailletii]
MTHPVRQHAGAKQILRAIAWPTRVYQRVPPKRKWLVVWAMAVACAFVYALAAVLIKRGSLDESDVPQSLFNGRTLFVELDLLTFTSTTNTISFSWYIVEDSCSYNNNEDVSRVEHNCPVVSIYIDTNALAPTESSHSNNAPSNNTSSNNTPSNNVSDSPIFLWNASAPLATGYFAQQATFTTSLNTGPRADRGRHGPMSYPWDQLRLRSRHSLSSILTRSVRYLAGIWINGLEENTNRTPVAIDVAWTEGVVFGYSTVIVPRHKLDAIEGNGSQQGEVEWSREGGTELVILISRTWQVKAFVVLIFAAMWAIDLLLLAIAIRGVFFRYPMEATVLVIPVTSLFAFTSLRSAMPGAPAEFGAIIDFAGTLPALTYLILISVICLAQFVRGEKVETNDQSNTEFKRLGTQDPEDLELEEVTMIGGSETAKLR